MATRLTLTSTIRRYIDEPDSANSHFTDAELYTFVNQAIRYMAADLEWPFQTAQATAVENQAIYTLPEDFISLTDMYFDRDDLTIIERADLPALSSTWQSTPAGRPLYSYKSDNAKIGLYPKPDAANAGLLLQIQYVKLPPDLDDDTDIPDIHLAFQDCIPFYVAFLCEHSMGNTKRAELNLNLFEQHKKSLNSKIQRFSDDTLRFRWAMPRMY